jgi:hypothetical protein
MRRAESIRPLERERCGESTPGITASLGHRPIWLRPNASMQGRCHLSLGEQRRQDRPDCRDV